MENLESIGDFFFLMAKKENIIKEKCQKSVPKYTGSIQRTPKGITKNQRGTTKNNSPST